MVHLRQNAGMSTGYVCPECGLDYDTISPSDAKVAIRSFPRRYRTALAAVLDDAEVEDALIRRRPQPDVWSALEYTAHVADLFEKFADVLWQMYTRDNPTIAFDDPDEEALAKRYNQLDPQDVLTHLDSGAAALAAQLDRMEGSPWERKGTFSWGERDLLTMLRNGVHEGSHHLRDVERVLDRVRHDRG
jgi:DNA segregation ATPase FtsK/SpoIIIE, S-DNA-T family